jgi:peptide/nickel transport system substrate-binding protein
LLPVAIERMRRSPRVEVRVVTVPRTRLMKLNAGSPFFDDVRERRALSMAIDRDGMAQVILRNPGSSASQLFPPILPDWHVRSVTPLKRDVAEAKRLLAEAGWTPGPDGILRQGDRRFRVQLRTFVSWPELPVMATAMQDQLREVGIDLDIAVGNSSEIPAGVKDGTLQIGLMSRNCSLVPDPLGTLIEDFSTANSDWGAMNWTNAELVALLQRLGATFDDGAKRVIRERIGAIIQDELPVIPLAWFELGVAISRRLSGVVIDPFELSYKLTDMRWAE